MSLIAYGCGFDFRQSSVIYMLYQIYFRAGRCHSEVDWPIFDGISRNSSHVQPIMPAESSAVFRTLIFSVFYLVLSVLLVITCILSSSESSENSLKYFLSNVNFCYYHSWTETNKQIATPYFLVVFCAFYYHFYCHHYLGLGVFRLLPCRLLFGAWS